jgi:hypothetical protein
MYFNSHPRIIYNDVEVVNIFTKIIPIQRLLENAIAWELYDLEDGESPELLSYRLYGSVKYHWVLMMINNVIDINKDWPLSTQNFGDFVDSKYDEPDAIHHWEDEDGNVVDAEVEGSTFIKNIKYEEELQKKKALIKVLKPEYLDSFVEEFKSLL